MNPYSRQSFLGQNSEEVLRGATVGIVGACGGGSHVAQQLAHVGVGSFVVIDPQTIEDTNLNRLVGATQRDVDRATPKVDIAMRVIKAVRPDAKVKALQKFWQSEGDALHDCDLIFGCLDSPRAKNELEAFCRRFLIPFIDIGMDVHGTAGHHLIAGQVILSMPGSPCLKCLGVITEEDLALEAARYGEAGGLPQVVWPNGVLASTAVGLAIQLLTPWHASPLENAYLQYDGNSGLITNSHRLKLAAAHPCPHYPANERGDPMFDVRTPAAPPARPHTFVEQVQSLLKKLFKY